LPRGREKGRRTDFTFLYLLGRKRGGKTAEKGREAVLFSSCQREEGKETRLVRIKEGGGKTDSLKKGDRAACPWTHAVRKKKERSDLFPKERRERGGDKGRKKKRAQLGHLEEVESASASDRSGGKGGKNRSEKGGRKGSAGDDHRKKKKGSRIAMMDLEKGEGRR